MNLRKILTIALLAVVAIYFAINAKKEMKKIENNYKIVKGDPLKARIYTLDNGLKVYLTSYDDAQEFKLILQ